MGIGVGIFLIVVGAVLAFAVDASFSGLDIAALGFILMIAGALGIALDLMLFGPRRRASVTTYADPVPAARRTTRTTTTDDII